MAESVFNEVKTLEQGKKYVMEVVAKVVEARRQVDALSALHVNATPSMLKNAWDNLNIRYGQALGALTTLAHCRVLDDVAYTELRMEVMNSKKPKLIGTVVG